MVHEGKIYYTEYGTPCKDYNEAVKIEEREREAAFIDRVLELGDVKKDHGTYCWIRDSAQAIYEHPEKFVIAMREYGIIPEGK